MTLLDFIPVPYKGESYYVVCKMISPRQAAAIASYSSLADAEELFSSVQKRMGTYIILHCEVMK